MEFDFIAKTKIDRKRLYAFFAEQWDVNEEGEKITEEQLIRKVKKTLFEMKLGSNYKGNNDQNTMLDDGSSIFDHESSPLLKRKNLVSEDFVKVKEG